MSSACWCPLLSDCLFLPCPCSGGVLQRCGFGVAGATHTGARSIGANSGRELSQQCQQALLPALRACNGRAAELAPQDGCCAAMEGAGEACLSQMAASLATNTTALAKL